MSYNLKIMINSLNFKFKIFTLSNFCSISIASMNPIIFKIVKNVVQNSIKLGSKIVIHQNNSSS